MDGETIRTQQIMKHGVTKKQIKFNRTNGVLIKILHNKTLLKLKHGEIMKLIKFNQMTGVQLKILQSKTLLNSKLGGIMSQTRLNKMIGAKIRINQKLRLGVPNKMIRLKHGAKQLRKML